jgi:hypothetical protein
VNVRNALTKFHPLPGGEGRGEGERKTMIGQGFYKAIENLRYGLRTSNIFEISR